MVLNVAKSPYHKYFFTFHLT